MFRARFDQIIDLNHPLAKLARATDWHFLESKFGAVYTETGGTISGKPLPWVPFSGVHVRPSNYPGGLFSVQSKSLGAILFSKTNKQPVYFGMASVREPKLFGIYDAARAAASDLPSILAEEIKKAQGG